MTDTTSVKLCAVLGCDQPRHVTKSGRVQNHCMEHMREDYKRELRSRTICDHPDCDKPVAKSRNDKPYRFCLEHERQHRVKYQQNWQIAHGNDKPTPAQRQAGIDRNPEIARSLEETFKVCLINHVNGTMTFLEGKVTQRCKTDALNMLPGAWELLLEGHAKCGYTIVERGTRPQAVTHAE